MSKIDDNLIKGSEQEVRMKRENTVENIKSDLKWFILMSLGLSVIAGIAMLACKYFNIQGQIESIGVIMMLIPATSVVIIKRYVNKEEISEGMNKLYGLTLVAFGMCSLSVVIESLLIKENVNISGIALIFVSIIGFIIMFVKREEFSKTIFSFKKNIGTVVLISFIFTVVVSAWFIISSLFKGDSTLIDNFPKLLFTFAIVGIANFVVGWFPFFGEEFGWRGYMQPRLQRIYGKRTGVIIGGLIWGIWHFPLCVMYYGPEEPFATVIFYLFYCVAMGIFIGYGYMKTRNIWLPIIIHIINNSFGGSIQLLFGKEPGGSMQEQIVLGLISLAIYGVFIFSKEYRGSREAVEIDIYR